LNNLIENIFNIKTDAEFESLALAIFNYQAKENKIYSDFLANLHVNPKDVKSITQIPFLPIELFKSQIVFCGDVKNNEIVFSSSGTTGITTSKHYVKDIDVYTESFRKGFAHFYGDIKEYAVLALLPSYIEREGSSLIYMVNDLIKESNNTNSNFYLHNISELVNKLQDLEKSNQKTLLIGVSFALLDLVENYSLKLKNTIVMETGGMKGKRKELIREELHSTLSIGLGVNSIHSEYGMTELLSQGYSKGDGIFECPPWMKILTRDPYDPLSINGKDKIGGINVIDLTNIHSCSFIATQDLGKTHTDGSFEVIGRFDQSDIRGCNLMIG
jgi:phenylacetate-coenzyme A ligase PaaK-like adenylate-forming protein